MAWEVDPPRGQRWRTAAPWDDSAQGRGCMDQLAPRAVATMVSVRWDIAMGLIGCC